jgi:hypothetical protein
MPFEHWFTVNFKTPQKDDTKKQYYEGFWEGYVAYHDVNVDRAEKDKHHKVKFDWVDEFNVKVMLDPLLNPEDSVVTYTLPAVVTAAAASSDPPLPPPPKR